MRYVWVFVLFLILTKNIKGKQMEGTFYDQQQFLKLWHFNICMLYKSCSTNSANICKLFFVFNQVSVSVSVCVRWWCTHSPPALHFADVTPFQKIHSVKCCVTLLYLCGDTRQRPLLKLTPTKPGIHCHTHAQRLIQCAVGLAVQPSLNESVAGWYDWDGWPFGTGMTKQWLQQVSEYESATDCIICLHLRIYTLYASKWHLWPGK